MDVRKSSSTNVNDVVVSKGDKVFDDDMIDMVECDRCEKKERREFLVKMNGTYANVMKQVDQVEQLKPLFKPLIINDNGSEVVVFDDEMVKIRSNK
ncbi:hypothetical protein Tco_1487665 [Tanacetum coccineum]